MLTCGLPSAPSFSCSSAPAPSLLLMSLTSWPCILPPAPAPALLSLPPPVSYLLLPTSPPLVPDDTLTSPGMIWKTPSTSMGRSETSGWPGTFYSQFSAVLHQRDVLSCCKRYASDLFQMTNSDCFVQEATWICVCRDAGLSGCGRRCESSGWDEDLWSKVRLGFPEMS